MKRFLSVLLLLCCLCGVASAEVRTPGTKPRLSMKVISGYLSRKMPGKALVARAFDPPWGQRKVPAFVSKAVT